MQERHFFPGLTLSTPAHLMVARLSRQGDQNGSLPPLQPVTTLWSVAALLSLFIATIAVSLPMVGRLLLSPIALGGLLILALLPLISGAYAAAFAASDSRSQTQDMLRLAGLAQNELIKAYAISALIRLRFIFALAGGLAVGTSLALAGLLVIGPFVLPSWIRAAVVLPALFNLLILLAFLSLNALALALGALLGVALKRAVTAALAAVAVIGIGTLFAAYVLGLTLLAVNALIAALLGILAEGF
ncbi:MAG: hypothetical protein GYB68_13605 [Chloroflexi bacterium]|nr:hypothetical protein [Chloroflexota bacterium]